MTIGDDPLPVFAKADGVLDFTSPAASVEFAGYAAQARIVHVIGTTGCSPDDDAKIAAAARHATIVKSGNMSLGVNLLAVLVEQAAKALGPEEFDIEILEMHHRTRSMRLPAPHCSWARRRRKAARWGWRNIACACATGTPAHGRPVRSDLPRCAAAPWSVTIR